MFRFICKLGCDNDKFIHAPMYTFNKVMQLFELANVVKCE